MQGQISKKDVAEDIKKRLRNVRKLIVTDLDGTLLNNRSELPQEYVDLIKEVLTPEVKLTMASGRGFPSVKNFSDRFPIDLPVICEGGAVVVDPITNSIIYETFIDEPIVRSIAEHLEAKQYGSNFYLYKGQTLTCYKRPEVHLFTDKEPAPIINIDLTKIPKEDMTGVRKIAVILDEKYLYDLQNELRNLFGEKVNIMRADDGCLDIMPVGVSKGSALQYLLHILDFPPSNVMAIGDNESDATMFDVVGFSVAMANADDYTKSKASFITTSNEDFGVLHAIKKFLEA
ncbi:Cof-type HAD-IIB family hydrolase [Coprothermobacter platensis]|uniref:Cof-type HAD-IIB family hydrolase n=1 Tax=Coprothermobacter platensis TaxID=108819 RepID=UPI0003A313C3|nr:Cof-type HAD-IIB family hydrolase [Coprothermobacter platensis]